MQHLLQTVYFTLFEPAQIGKHSHKRIWWQAALIIWLVSTLLVFTQAGNQASPPIGLALITAWLGSFLGWWGFSLLLHFSADIFGGQGRFADTMTAVGLSSLPLLFLAPLAALPNLLGTWGYTLSLLGKMALVFWLLALLVLAIHHSEAFSLDRAIGALILTVGVMLILGVTTIILFGLQLTLWGLTV